MADYTEVNARVLIAALWVRWPPEQILKRAFHTLHGLALLISPWPFLTSSILALVTPSLDTMTTKLHLTHVNVSQSHKCITNPSSLF